MLSGPDKNKYYNPLIKEQLKKIIKSKSKISLIAADPSNHIKNDRKIYGNEN